MSPILGIWASQNYPRVTNSYESIATTTVGGGGSSTVTFSSIPSTYKHLQIRAIARYSRNISSTGSTDMYFNTDTTYTNYRTHYLYGDGASTGAGTNQSSGRYAGGPEVSGNTSTANVFAVSIIDILDYANTSKYKTVRQLSGNDVNGSGGDITLASSIWMSTSAVTSLTLDATVTGAYSYNQYSSFALYGVKG